MHAYIKGSAWLSPSGFKTLTNRDQAASSPFITEESIQNIHLPKLPRVPDVAKACCAVVSQVLLEAGLTVPFAVRSEESERTALVVGNNDSSVRPIEALQREAEIYGPNRVSPAIFPNTVYNALAGYIAIHVNIKGTNTTLSGATSTVPAAILYGLRLLAKGRHDRVVVCHVHLLPSAKKATRQDEEGGSFSPEEERITALLLKRPGVGTHGKYALDWELTKANGLYMALSPDVTPRMDVELIKLIQEERLAEQEVMLGRFQNGDLLKLRFNNGAVDGLKEAHSR